MSKQVSFDLMSHENYRKCWDHLMSLRQRITQADAEIQKLLANEKPESIKSQKQRQVEAILQGVEPDNVEPIEKWREDLRAAYQRIYLFREAEKEQQRILGQEQLKASGLVCESVRPEYSALIKEIASKLVELGEALLKEKDLRECLNDANIAYQAHDLMPCPFLPPGDPHDYQSRLGYWMREAVRLGYIVENDIPKEWLDAWFRRDGYRMEKPGKTVDQVLSRVRTETKVVDESEWSAAG